MKLNLVGSDSSDDSPDRSLSVDGLEGRSDVGRIDSFVDGPGTPALLPLPEYAEVFAERAWRPSVQKMNL